MSSKEQIEWDNCIAEAELSCETYHLDPNQYRVLRVTVKPKDCKTFVPCVCQYIEFPPEPQLGICFAKEADGWKVQIVNAVNREVLAETGFISKKEMKYIIKEYK